MYDSLCTEPPRNQCYDYSPRCDIEERMYDSLCIEPPNNQCNGHSPVPPDPDEEATGGDTQIQSGFLHRGGLPCPPPPDADQCGSYY